MVPRSDRPLERWACVVCPFQSRQRWVETERRWPELFAEAVETDARMRQGLALDKLPTCTPRMPLAQAVAHNEAEPGAEAQTGGGSATSARCTVGCDCRGRRNPLCLNSNFCRAPMFGGRHVNPIAIQF